MNLRHWPRIAILLTLNLLAWGSLAIQFGLLLQRAGGSLAGAVQRFLMFFTLVSNTLAAIFFLCLLLRPVPPRFFRRWGVSAALSAYLIFVAAVYQLLLTEVWNPQGWQYFTDRIFHLVMPLAVVGYWLTCDAGRDALRWSMIPAWLLIPAIYLAFVLLTGPWAGRYPYPFFSVSQLGYPLVLRNIALLTLVFLGLSAGLIALSGFLKRFRK